MYQPAKYELLSRAFQDTEAASLIAKLGEKRKAINVLRGNMTGSARSSSDAIPVFPVSSLCHYHDITIRRQSSSVTDCYGGTNTGQGEPRNPIKSIPPSFRQCCQYSSQKGLVDPVSQSCGVILLS